MKKTCGRAARCSICQVEIYGKSLWTSRDVEIISSLIVRRWRLVPENGRHSGGLSVADSTHYPRKGPGDRSDHASVNDQARLARRGLILPSPRFVPSQRRAGVAGLTDEAPEFHLQLPEGNRSANENRVVRHEHRHRDTGRYARRLQPLHDRENAPIPPGTKVPRGSGKP
ncbi:hypothetical protein Spb1_23930 [Planctopirus ephydatiae]|uniref:Uncharacterized protein n=1 Tax=Planctopirus ephydatiae TaxID=2528019 RepID=A0A518GPA8_9PLAN|nr:hypothetical protein Spb1_23930 [Planctopirus ephydatiae]